MDEQLEQHTPTDEDRTTIAEVRRQVEEAQARLPGKPERIGRYRILGVLGQGGMGVVYEARQEHPSRTVALKVMRWGLVSPEMLRRFDKEAQALGRLHHVGIAHIYEGGTADDGHGIQPFFAMELVDGLPLTDYCEANNLSTAARLELLAKVCDAVEHAHQNNVIHRDLKPSNILVKSDGQPKIVDFGVARVTDADIQAATLKTEARRLVGTLPYMSPEQIRGDPHEIDIRSDVYALGMLGYRMLTGRYPFVIPRNSIPMAARVIQEEEPTRLRFVNRSLRGEIDTIIIKALEKEPARRYQSSAELAADLRRYLNAEPIRARPSGNLYRFHKFARRNKALVGGLAGVIAALMIGLIVSTRAYRLADRRLEDFRQLADARDLDRYVAEAERLWPAHPEKITEMEAWIKAAEELRPRLLQYRSKLIALHERTVEFNLTGDLDRTSLRYAEELGEVRRELASRKRILENLAAAGTDDNLRSGSANIEARIRRLEKEEIELEALIPRTHICIFDDPADRLEHDVLLGLVFDLQAFFIPRTGVVADVHRRSAIARTIEFETIDRYREQWDEAVASIADARACPQYDGLHIIPQIGLIPLGRDRDTNLWEFAHRQSGEPPSRGAKGMLKLDEDSSLVFVLIPGSTFDMGGEAPTPSRPIGALHIDPYAMAQEGPLHRITLLPFFLSKYEMTQEQWERLTGKTPSTYHSPVARPDVAPSLLHPVENVSWVTCEAVLWRMGLTLPSEAQWEYAARAGTKTPWWTGGDRESLRGAANLADKTYRQQGGPRSAQYDDWLEDGYGETHAPVGSFRANGFGLHDVLGNVAEWCYDAFGDYDLPSNRGTGKREAGQGQAGYRIVRGGSFLNIAAEARCAARTGIPPEDRRRDLGLRPGRALRRPKP